MSKVELRVCDLCKDEQRQDQGIYWANRFDGPVVFDFKKHAAIQQKREFETLCNPCVRLLSDGVFELIESVKLKRSKR